MHFLFLEPFYGGSHREFADGLVAHSRHRIDLFTLPARFWKWRMRGAALHFIDQITDFSRYDGIICSSLLSLSDLMALAGPYCPPALVYFHENQLTYPLSPGERRDYQYGFTDITTALCADRILFNSASHRQAFLARIPDFLAHMPDYRPAWVTGAIAEKSAVLFPGCDFETAPASLQRLDLNPPLIIWNHRWEFDKNPDGFFSALEQVKMKGIDFRLALLGQNFNRIPKAFESARNKLGSEIVHWGYLPCRKTYYQWLAKGAIVVSTAIQENFGLAVVEAMAMGCLPLLPLRLCYPEILPKPYHSDFIYQDTNELLEKLTHLLTNFHQYAPIRTHLARRMQAYAWPQIILKYDAELDTLKADGRN